MLRGNLMDWFTEARIKREEAEANGEEYTYANIAKDYGKHYDTVRKAFKAYKTEEGIVDTPKPKEPEEDINVKTLRMLERGCTLQQLSDSLKLSYNVCTAIIDDLKSDGYQITTLGGNLKIAKIVLPQDYSFSYHWNGDKVFRLGVVSDTHLCSINQQLTHLNTM